VRQISSHPLWVGNALDGADLRRLHFEGVEALIDVGMNEPVPMITRELIYCRFPLFDGAGNRIELLRLAIQTTAALISAATPTLVFCSAGMSRSPAIAAAALAIVTRKTPDECLAEVFGTGPRDLSPPLWSDILKSVVDCQPSLLPS
jgi:hypothetical protein